MSFRAILSYEEHLAQRVRKTRRYKARTSLDRGLEVLEFPPPAWWTSTMSSTVASTPSNAGSVKYSRANSFTMQRRASGKEDKLLVMRFENRVVGGGALLFDRHAVHYFHGTIDRSVKGVFPHAVLYSEALKRAYGRGLRYVNLGGVNQGNDSLVDFKKNLGRGTDGRPQAALALQRGSSRPHGASEAARPASCGPREMRRPMDHARAVLRV